MTSEEEIKYDRDLLGVEHRFGPFNITTEMILKFSTCTGDTNPLYSDQEKARKSVYGSLIAPPTFCHLFITDLNRPDIKLEFGDTGLLARQTIENLVPIRPGDRLDATIKLKEVYTKRGRSGEMAFIVWETCLTNQDAEIVTRMHESFAWKNSQRR